MRAGELRHRVSIQEETQTSDGMGGFTLVWSNVSGMGSVPAAVWPLRSNEILRAGKLEEQVTHKIRIRYRSGITAKNRIYWSQKNKTYNIKSIINPDERDIMLEIMATEEI